MTDSERLERIDEKLDALTLRFDDFRVNVERRLSRLEMKAALLGTLGGAAVGFAMQVLGR